MRGTPLVSELSCWKAYGNLRVLNKIQSMSTWSCNVLEDSRREVMEYRVDKIYDARLNRWTSVGHAKQVLAARWHSGCFSTHFTGA